MKYLGSKNRISKHILPIILKDRKPEQWYVEPFVGGANLIDKVDGNRIGADSNEYMICLLKALQSGWKPPKEINKEEYQKIKDNRDSYPNELRAYCATQLVFGSIWFGSYRRDNTGERNYSLEAYNNVIKQAPNLKGICFKCCDYKDLEIPPNSIIYCDPPYKGTRPYIGTNKLNHDELWQWCREQARNGHVVYVSEYEAPNDFKEVWSKQVESSGNKVTGHTLKATEKLFLIEPIGSKVAVAGKKKDMVS